MMHANDTKVTHIFVGAWCNPPVEAAEVPVESADLELRQLKALEYETQLSDALGFASCMIWLPPSHDSRYRAQEHGIAVGTRHSTLFGA